VRFATVRLPSGSCAARVEGDTAVLLDAPDVGALLAEGPLGSSAGREIGIELPFAEADLAPVVVRPAKVICIGMNYRAHIEEVGAPMPEYPMLFAKFASSLIGANDQLTLPTVSSSVDWEAELGVVVGADLKRGSADEARAAIAGYVVANDISMRDWQFRSSDVLQGKAFDGSTPVGPVLVTPDEIDHGGDLELLCEIDGQVVQRARTSDMVFSPAEIVSYVSHFAALAPGDLLLTGTPAGVGFGRDPKIYLSDGQVVRTSIEGIGQLVNRCRAEVPVDASCPA
jgi:acylpyruvate hydrolase